MEASSHTDVYLWEQGTNPGPPDFDPPAASFGADHTDATDAPGFGAFSASAGSSAPPAVGSVAPAATAGALQTSSLAPGAISASGQFLVLGDSGFLTLAQINAMNALLMPPIPYVGGIAQGRESARSEFSVDFELSAPTPYHLVGNVAHTPATIGEIMPYPSSGIASIELSGPAGIVAAVSIDPPGGSQDIDVDGVLAPGSYTLSATGGGVTNAFCFIVVPCDDPAISGSYELSLTLGAEVPGPSRGWLALLGVALAATGTRALRRR